MSARLITGQPMAEYLAIDAASRSRLAKLAQSPAHLKADMQRPDTQTDAQALGDAIHVAILEADHFTGTYARGPINHRGKREWKEFAAELEGTGVKPLRPSDYDMCLAIRDAVYARPAARLIMNAVEDTEVTALWTDPKLGVDCKGRPDALCPSRRVVVDIKSAVIAGVTAFEKAIYEYKYYWQAAWYLDGLAEIGESYDTYVILALEKSPPYAANAFPVRGDAIQAGRDEMRPLLALYAECKARDEWPLEGPEYPANFHEISLPPWAWRRVDERLERGAA